MTKLAEAPRRVDLPGSIESISVLNTVGRRIAWARMRKDLTQVELAKKLEKSRASIVQYERDNINPPVDVIVSIAKLLGVAPEFLAFGRQGIDGINEAGEILPISEFKMGRDNEFRSSGYAISTSMLNDFNIAQRDLQIHVLSHDAKQFGFDAGSRVIVATDIKEPSRDQALFLVRTNDGYDVIRVERGYTKGSVDTITAGNGTILQTPLSALDVVGAVVTIMQKV